MIYNSELEKNSYTFIHLFYIGKKNPPEKQCQANSRARSSQRLKLVTVLGLTKC